MTSEMQSVADAIVQAIRVATSQTSQAPHSSSSGTMRTYDRVSTTVSGTSGSVSGSGQRLATSMMINDHPGPSSSTAPSPAGKLVIPTMFQSKGAKRSKPVKTVRYLRDIFCLPRDVLNGETGTIGIPRGTRRNSLANKDVGLLGKIEFESVWSAERMKQEISLECFLSPLSKIFPEESAFNLNICNEQEQDLEHYVCQLWHRHLNGMGGRWLPLLKVEGLYTF